MPFDPVDPRQSFPALERAILQYWKEEAMFHRSVEQRRDAKTFSFYDGPPFATGLPHYGHLLAGTIKDVIPRYQTMRGHKVERRFGWDCHGLPIENLIEKEHGIKTKQDIEAMGVKAFNDLCRGSVQRYVNEWRETVERMGRWVDMDWDYRTMDPEYMESIWWVFAQLYEKGLIYEGHKPMHVCPRCQTPLSNFEVTQGYKDVTDVSAVVRFETQDSRPESRVYFLAWTTTPWTLPGNLFLAVHPKTKYATVACDGAQYIVAEPLVESVFAGKEYVIEGKSIVGSALVGKKYEPLFPYFAADYPNAFRVVAGDFVTTEDGTGIVHIAPGFGEDDFNVGKAEDVPVLQHVKIDGTFVDAVTDFAGMEVKPKDHPTQADKAIVKYLEKHGSLFASKSFTHSYPHCWRCDSPLLNYATSSWFVSVEKIKEDMLDANSKTQWVPEHLRDGRFGKWLEGARDWAISRNRYWGTPLPIWRNETTGNLEVISGRDELMSHCPERFTKVTIMRHGQSEGNLIPIYQGAVPGTDLTDEGRKQAKEAGAFLANQDLHPVTVVYASPLNRTQQTAEGVIKETGAKLVIDERLKEIDMGPYEMQRIPFDDLDLVRKMRTEKMKSHSPSSSLHMPEMESWESIQKRLTSFLDEVLRKHKGEHIVIVSHGDPILGFRHLMTKQDPFKIAHGHYPHYASPESYFWDHETGACLDLHKETVDPMTWKDDKGHVYKRIPEVLDCWFESGSMPYAQGNFPFAFGDTRHKTQDTRVPEGFPADFVAENLDQTRGWFYTLMVLSSALYKQPAFKNCICGGIILAEDGKKMSKRLKNYPDPNELMDKHGADALRFALMSSPVVRAETLRFSEKGVAETVQNVLLPLWNSYSFFVTYAKAAQFTPATKPSLSPHPLDQWMRAQVQDLVNRMTEELEAYDLSATCEQLYETIDALTNWYIRLSRRRFAGKEGGKMSDSGHAMQTLYDALVTIAQLLAPFCPFVTEAIYQNLVGEPHGSIHLTSWPEVKKLTKEENLLVTKHTTMQKIVKLGNRVRSEQKIKLRQPLASATIAVPASVLQTDALSDEDHKLLLAELNVKELHFTKDPGSLGQAIAMVNARMVGPRLGGRVQEIITAGKQGEFSVQKDGSVLILDVTLAPDEVQILYKGGEGQNIAADGGVIVSVDSRITDDLVAEGLARDLIRQIQKLRKDQGLEMGQTVDIAIEGADDVLKTSQALIESETMTNIGKKKGTHHEVEIGDGQKITITL